MLKNDLFLVNYRNLFLSHYFSIQRLIWKKEFHLFDDEPNEIDCDDYDLPSGVMNSDDDFFAKLSHSLNELDMSVMK